MSDRGYMMDLTSASCYYELTKRFSELPPLHEEPAIKAPPKSDKRDKIVPLLKSLPLEFKAKPLPERFDNWPVGAWANSKIRVDNIPTSVADCWGLVIISLTQMVFYSDDGSTGYAILDFDRHCYAKDFVEKFNNKQIPGTDMVYQLSWAPFYDNLVNGVSESSDEDTEENNICKKKNQRKLSMSEAKSIKQHVPISDVLYPKIRAFHACLYDKAPDRNALSRRMKYGGEDMVHRFDDGLTTILCLTMVDPCVEEGFMKSIFEEYGDCTICLPNKRGYGFVKFEQRECAETALADLATDLKDEHVCCLDWCCTLKDSLPQIKRNSKRIDQEIARLYGTKTSKRPTRAPNSVSKARRGRK